MKIKITDIKPSTIQLRDITQTNLQELAASMEVQGAIGPIKVRPIKDDQYKYEVVYGNRRLAASIMAGLKQLDAIVADMDDLQSLTEAIIENIQRENMSELEQGRSFLMLQEAMGPETTKVEVAQALGISRQKVSRLSTLAEDEVIVKKIISRPAVSDPEEIEDSPRALSIKAQVLRGAFGEEDEELRSLAWDFVEFKHHHEIKEPIRLIADLENREFQKDIIQKGIDENLSPSQLTRVVESVDAAPSEKIAKQLIKWPYRETTHDPDFIRERAETIGAHDAIYGEDEEDKKHRERREKWEASPEVAKYINQVTDFNRLTNHFVDTIEVGKLAPEGRPFIKRKLKLTIGIIQKVIDIIDGLENANGK